MLSKNDIVGDRFTLLTQIKVSSTTETWTAKDNTLERFVELEFLQKRLVTNDRAFNFFHAQSLATAQLNHPNLIPIIDYDNYESMPYIVRSFIPSTRLFDFVRQSKRVDFSRIIKILQQIGNCIDYLHSLSIIHRNIKSQNIMIGSSDRAYLTGLNVIYHPNIDDTLTREGVIVGTMPYLSPESFLGESDASHNLPPRDIYAFGIVVYEALTGCLPFQITNGGIKEWREIHNDGEIPLISKDREDLSINFDLIIKKLLAKHPQDRYKTVTTATEDLNKALFSGKSNIQGKVFISYASKDKDYVHRLADELRGIGLDIWIDSDIPAGTNWADGIENGLKESDVMLLIVTEDSMDSDYVTHEWSYFMGSGKPVYPFVLDGTLPKNVHPRLEHFQFSFGTDDMLGNVSRIIEMLSQK